MKSIIRLLIFGFILVHCITSNSFATSINNSCIRDSDCRAGYRCQKCWGEHCFQCVKRQNIKWEKLNVRDVNLFLSGEFEVYGSAELDLSDSRDAIAKFSKGKLLEF